MGLRRNVANQKWRVFAFNRNTNIPVTGDAANITAKIAKDWAAAAATNDVNPTEVEDGFYNFDLTQAESDGDVLDLFPESSTADVQVVGVPGTMFTVNRAVTLPGQEAPPLTPTPDQMMAWLYKNLRNRKEQTTGQWRLFADDESTVDAIATVSDSAGVARKTEIVAGP